MPKDRYRAYMSERAKAGIAIDPMTRQPLPGFKKTAARCSTNVCLAYKDEVSG